MAIFHFSRNGIAPFRGQSAAASSAYMSGMEMVSEVTGEVFRYCRSERVLATGVQLPEGHRSDSGTRPSSGPRQRLRTAAAPRSTPIVTTWLSRSSLPTTSKRSRR